MTEQAGWRARARMPVPRGSGEAEEGERAFRFGWRALVFVFAFWSFFGALTTANRLLDSNEYWGFRRFRVETAYWFFDAYLWAAATPLVFWLAWRLSTRPLGRVSRAILLLLVGVVVAAFMTIAGDVVRVHVLHIRPPAWRASLLDEITRPWLVLRRSSFLEDLITFAGILAAWFAREFLLRYRAREQDTIRLQAHAAQLQAESAELKAQSAHLHAQLAEARLTVLRTQLNPHFLFNTLNAMSALVEKDPRGVRDMIALLSELLRYALRDTTEQEIPLKEELELLRLYLEILEIRYQGQLRTTIDADAEVLGALVPNLILQPLAENAMKHAVAMAGGSGRIEVLARRGGEELVLTVRDTGPGDGATPAPAAAGAGVGLRHTRARLEELYGGRQSFDLRPAPGGGMIAEVVLPFRAHHDAHPAADARPGKERSRAST